MTTTIEAEVVQREPQTQAVAIRQPESVSLFRTDDPQEVVKRATGVATALRDVIEKQGLISTIQGKKYPKCEAWTLCGTMLGIFPVLSWSRPIEGGWEARVEAKTRTGEIVGAAEAECLKSERNWSNRDDFAIRSMAQTRATAKALRMPLGFIMTLAGYEATPVEEMPHNLASNGTQPHHDDGDLGPQKPGASSKPEPAQKTEKTATPATARTDPMASKAVDPTGKCATTAQRDKMLAELIAKYGDQNLLKDYACKAGILLPTETLLDWPLRFVPATKGQYDLLDAAVRDFIDGEDAVKPFVNAEPPPAKAAKVEVPRDKNCDPASDDAPWRKFVVPFGQHKGTALGNLDQRPLYGFWAGFEVKPTFEGRDGPVKKSAASLAKDKEFRAMLDEAGSFYEFTKKEAA